MTIDANMYWMPPELFTSDVLLQKLLEAVPNHNDTWGRVEPIPGSAKRQIVLEKPLGFPNLNYAEGEYDPGRQIAAMDAAGVDLAILKLPGCQEWLTLDLCKTFNRGMVDHVRRHPTRFRALAVVPPYATQEGIAELEKCLGEYGMTGVQLSSHYGGRYLDHPDFRPFLEVLNALKVPAYIHHSPLPVDYSSLLDFPNLRRSFGRCSDQFIAVSREIFSDLFAQLPNLTFVHSMLGGGYFAFHDLILPVSQAPQGAVDRFASDVQTFRDRLKTNIAFEMSHASPWGAAPLTLAVQTLGAESVIFGSSYPVKAEWLQNGPSFVRELPLTDGEKSQVLGKTAEAVYRLGASR